MILVSRREVDAGDIASELSRQKSFLATRDDAWLDRGQMTLVVDDYNQAPRELVDIHEVRTSLRALESSGPPRAYFFNQVDTASLCSRPASPGADSTIALRSKWTPTSSRSPWAWRLENAADSLWMQSFA